MNPEFVSAVCNEIFSQTPQQIERFSVGQGNYVFYVQMSSQSYVFRCSQQPYRDTLYYLETLHKLDIPVSKVVAHGQRQGLYYMIAIYLEGKELGDIYPQLSEHQKLTLAKEVIQIQDRVSRFPMNISCNWTKWVDDMLTRAKTRIQANGYFDAVLVDQLFSAASELQHYFEQLTPRPYLDDITTKNLLVKDGHISGIIDVDWMGFGDRLTFIALTHMALLNLQYDTTYTQYLLDQLPITPEQQRAFQFYTLMYCVDFMGERGSTFLGRSVPVNDEIIARLNHIYAQLWTQYHA